MTSARDMCHEQIAITIGMFLVSLCSAVPSLAYLRIGKIRKHIHEIYFCVFSEGRILSDVEQLEDLDRMIEETEGESSRSSSLLCNLVTLFVIATHMLRLTYSPHTVSSGKRSLPSHRRRSRLVITIHSSLWVARLPLQLMWRHRWDGGRLSLLARSVVVRLSRSAEAETTSCTCATTVLSRTD